MLRQKLLGETMVGYDPEDISKKDPFMLDIKAEKGCDEENFGSIELFTTS